MLYAPAGIRRGPSKGRPPRHGAKLVLRDPDTRPDPACSSQHEIERGGTVQVTAFERMRPKLESRAWVKDHQSPLPLIESTVIGLHIERLPGNAKPKPMWLWASKPVPENAAQAAGAGSRRPMDLDRAQPGPRAGDLPPGLPEHRAPGRATNSPGPGRPKGGTNRLKPTLQHVGKAHYKG